MTRLVLDSGELTDMSQCRYCSQWFDREKQDIELYGYCSVSCVEIDYATFRHITRKLTVNDV